MSENENKKYDFDEYLERQLPKLKTPSLLKNKIIDVLKNEDAAYADAIATLKKVMELQNLIRIQASRSGQTDDRTLVYEHLIAEVQKELLPDREDSISIESLDSWAKGLRDRVSSLGYVHEQTYNNELATFTQMAIREAFIAGFKCGCEEKNKEYTS